MYTGPARMHWSLQQRWPCSFWDFLVHGFRHDFEKKKHLPLDFTQTDLMLSKISALCRDVDNINLLWTFVITHQKGGWKTYLALHLLRAYGLRLTFVLLGNITTIKFYHLGISITHLFSVFTLKKARMFCLLHQLVCQNSYLYPCFFSILVTRQRSACTNNTIACCHWSLLAQALRVASKIISSTRRRSCDALRRDKVCCHAPPEGLSRALNKNCWFSMSVVNTNWLVQQILMSWAQKKSI